MKFLIERDDQITIYKFTIDDNLIEADRDKVWFYGVYKNDPSLRLAPLKTKKYPIFKSQIAQDKHFIYIPSDQIENDNTYLYEWPKIIARKTIDKSDWKTMKTNYPYKGV